MAGQLRHILYIMSTGNPLPGERLTFFPKWLVITRACVLPMTWTAGLLGIVLAWRDGHSSWFLSILLMLGLTFAHAANNVLNDLMDYRSGVDTPSYHRALYAPHPILSGLTSQSGLLLAFFLFTAVDLFIMLFFTVLRGPAVIAFAVAGLAISVLYVGWTYSLKFIGLGELAVLIVWGPLMVGGTYFVLSGHLPMEIYLASFPYALLVTTVILGKHIDKRAMDQAKGIRTLPVLLGEKPALRLTQSMIVAYYLLVAISVSLGVLPWPALLTLLSLPKAFSVWKVLNAPIPKTPPPDWPIWPLWYVGWCFTLVKPAGGWLLLGIALQAIFRFFV